MAVDEMEIDSNPASTGPLESEKERKRKHKHKDQTSSPSKKKRKHEKADEAEKKSKKKDKSSKSKGKSTPSAITQPAQQGSASVIPDSPYSLTTATLYLPLSPISISPTHALASLLAEHLSPLLLTYYPPLQGIILAYSNASISSHPPSASSTSSPADLNPQPLTLAATAGEYGVMYVYLTATFLVFRPQRGQLLEGWVNVQSEGFLGAVLLNLFSVGIERKRLPPTWKWIPPGEEDEMQDSSKPTSSAPTSSDEDDEESTSSPFDPEKEHFNPVSLASDANPFSYDSLDTTAPTTGEEGEGEGDVTAQDQQGAFDISDESLEGHFQSISGHRVRGTVKFRVVDIDVIPGSERDRGFLSIEGTMLSPEEEAKVLEDEKNGIIAPLSAARKTTMTTIPILAMSGGLAAPEDENEVVDIELDSPSKKPVKGKGKGKKQR
jgi:DNA-directed RNA polymerase I subunit RPA43